MTFAEVSQACRASTFSTLLAGLLDVKGLADGMCKDRMQDVKLSIGTCTLGQR